MLFVAPIAQPRQESWQELDTGGLSLLFMLLLLSLILLLLKDDCARLLQPMHIRMHVDMHMNMHVFTHTHIPTHAYTCTCA